MGIFDKLFHRPDGKKENQNQNQKPDLEWADNPGKIEKKLRQLDNSPAARTVANAVQRQARQMYDTLGIEDLSDGKSIPTNGQPIKQDNLTKENIFPTILTLLGVKPILANNPVVHANIARELSLVSKKRIDDLLNDILDNKIDIRTQIIPQLLKYGKYYPQGITFFERSIQTVPVHQRSRNIYNLWK